MYELLKRIIAAGGYDLADLTNRIDVLYASGRLTDDQRRMLVQTAQDNADPDDTLPDADARIGALELRVAELESRVGSLESPEQPSGGTTDDPSDSDAWPEYRQPESKDKYYMKGDRVSFNGRHWTCVKNNVASDPLAYPKAWRDEGPADTGTAE